MQQLHQSVPPGIQLLKTTLRKQEFSVSFYKASVLGITFIAYAFYHAARKPNSIVKSVLHPDVDGSGRIGGWEPFVGKKGKERLGIIDVAFLGFYALGMFFAGQLGDRLNLRIFLTIGMLGSGVFVCLFGVAYWLNIHSLTYFIAMQILAGLFQATGWPSVVAVVAKWFDKKSRGLIMGIWNCHTSVGNIVGSLLAAHVLEYGWGWSFVVPGILMVFGAGLVFLFLVVDPEYSEVPSVELVDTNKPHQNDVPKKSAAADVKTATDVLNLTDEQTAIGFFEAWAIPGVAQFAICLFFSKLVAYTFLYWLPFYIRHTSTYLSDKMAGRLSTFFDVGGMVGGIVAGSISDRFNAKATTAALFLYIAVPALVVYRFYGNSSLVMNIGLMMVLGMFINGPYALITTAVSADLGTHSSLNGNAKALATVTAIIDGTGSVGAAVGPLLTGFVAANGWNAVFVMLILSVLIAGLLLTRLAAAEVRDKFRTSSSFQRIGPDDVTDNT